MIVLLSIIALYRCLSRIAVNASDVWEYKHLSRLFSELFVHRFVRVEPGQSGVNVLVDVGVGRESLAADSAQQNGAKQSRKQLV
jgi:hypothetical protein